MIIRKIIFLFSACIIICSQIQAQYVKKSVFKSGAKFLALKKSYSQQTVPGVRGMTPTITIHFMAQWASTDCPRSFFWRGDNTWTECKLQLTKKPTSKSSKINSCKGAAIEVITLRGSRSAMPEGIPQSANTLYFQMSGDTWYSIPVKKITKMPDIVMP